MLGKLVGHLKKKKTRVFTSFTMHIDYIQKKLKTFETKAAWSSSVASLGYACSGLRTTCLALQTLLYHSLFFYREEMFSIINHVVLVFPEPSPWKGDPELVSGSVVTVSRSNWFPGWEGEKVFPGTFQSQRSWTDTSALVKREKDQGPSNDITLRCEETVPNHVTDFSLWQWFWKGIHIILAI